MQLASDVDWGTVPQWISGILAGVSVILAFFIILRDRTLRDTEQIRSMTWWKGESTRSKTTVGYTEYTQKVYIRNESKLPLFDVGSAVVEPSFPDLRRERGTIIGLYLAFRALRTNLKDNLSGWNRSDIFSRYLGGEVVATNDGMFYHYPRHLVTAVLPGEQIEMDRLVVTSDLPIRHLHMFARDAKGQSWMCCATTGRFSRIKARRQTALRYTSGILLVFVGLLIVLIPALVVLIVVSLLNFLWRKLRRLNKKGST